MNEMSFNSYYFAITVMIFSFVQTGTNKSQGHYWHQEEKDKSQMDEL